MNGKRATRNSWKTTVMPELKAQIPFERIFSIGEYQRLSWGLIPEEMEDKWFIFLEDHWLYLHRSWTGICIYQLRLEAVCDKYKVVEAWVNCDPKQHKSKNDKLEVELLSFLIDRLLLGKNKAFPSSFEISPEQSAIFEFHMIGYGRANDETIDDQGD
jgi:hypothetical protein